MSERLTLQDLVDLLSEKQGITKKDAENFIRELVDLTSETISQKDFVRIKDLGTFKLTPVKARRSVDVNTGEAIEIAAHYKLGFTPEKVLREAVNRPFAHFESILVDEDVVFQEKKVPVINKEEKKREEVKTEEAKIEVQEPVVEKIEETIVEAAPVITEVVEKVEEKKEEVLEKSAAVIEEVETIVLEATEEEEKNTLDQFVEKDKVEGKIEEQSAVETSAFVESDAVESEKDKKEDIQSVEPENAVDDDDDDDDWDDRAYAEERKNRNLKIIIGILVALLLVVGYWGYKNYYGQEEVQISVEQNNSNITISDDENNEGETSETLEGGQATASDVSSGETTEESNVDTPSVKTEEEARVIEVELGKTMRQLGEKYYGYRAFWVYIFEENKEVISRPDAIYAGMKLTLPPASKYGIDANSAESRRKADQKEKELFAQFEKDNAVNE